MTFLANSNLILQISLKRGILGASTIILFKDIDKYVFMCGSIFYETDVIYKSQLKKWLCWQIIFVIVSIGILIILLDTK